MTTLDRPPAAAAQDWPALEYAASRDTLSTLQLWTQVVGKVRLALSPWMNHGWQVPLYVTARGLGTSAIHAGPRIFEIEFDLVRHRLELRSDDGVERGFTLEPMSVARFHQRVMALLQDAGIEATINVMPNEVASPIPFPQDEVHASYDASAVTALWRGLVQCDRVFRLFRTA